MKFSIPSKTTTETSWGMGFLLIFFPEEHHQQINKKPPNNFTTNLLSQSQILHRTQSTLSICLLLLFTTALLFTLSTLPSSPTGRRRMLPELPHRNSNLSHALQRMGVLYRRGTCAMNDVVVAHVLDSLTSNDLSLFLRLFLRSSLAARSDLVLLFPARTAALNAAILRENDFFTKLLDRYGRNSSNFAHFAKKMIGEPIWGRRIRPNSSAAGEAAAELETPASYGSIVGFDVDELDPENSLSGFFENNVPMSFRRWACYPMLRGRVRRNFKHVMLVDVKEVLLIGDPVAGVRKLSPESVVVHLSKQGKKNPNPDSTRRKSIIPGMVMGGSRGIRRLSSEMLTSIVRSSMQRNKRKNPISESALLSLLVENNSVLRNVNLVVAPESIPELGSQNGSGMKNYGMIRNENSSNNNLDFYSVVMKHICSFPIDSTVYSAC